MICEYDGQPLPMTEGGEGAACPTCEADLNEHMALCRDCRENSNLPEAGGLDLTGLLA